MIGTLLASAAMPMRGKMSDSATREVRPWSIEVLVGGTASF